MCVQSFFAFHLTVLSFHMSQRISLVLSPNRNSMKHCPEPQRTFIGSLGWFENKDQSFSRNNWEKPCQSLFSIYLNLHKTKITHSVCSYERSERIYFSPCILTISTHNVIAHKLQTKFIFLFQKEKVLFRFHFHILLLRFFTSDGNCGEFFSNVLNEPMNKLGIQLFFDLKAQHFRRIHKSTYYYDHGEVL
jgi:hypothetical protein